MYASELSRPAIFEAVRAGHAYVRTLGVAGSPALELHATAPNGPTVMMGDTLVASSASMTATITGGAGQVMLITRDGLPWLPVAVPITSDPFTYTWTADRSPLSGPLGTFWRVDIADAAEPRAAHPDLQPDLPGRLGPGRVVRAVGTVRPNRPRPVDADERRARSRRRRHESLTARHGRGAWCAVAGAGCGGRRRPAADPADLAPLTERPFV